MGSDVREGEKMHATMTKNNEGLSWLGVEKIKVLLQSLTGSLVN